MALEKHKLGIDKNFLILIQILKVLNDLCEILTIKDSIEFKKDGLLK